MTYFQSHENNISIILLDSSTFCRARRRSPAREMYVYPNVDRKKFTGFKVETSRTINMYASSLLTP